VLLLNMNKAIHVNAQAIAIASPILLRITRLVEKLNKCVCALMKRNN
jgi:hypothetical protein